MYARTAAVAVSALAPAGCSGQADPTPPAQQPVGAPASQAPSGQTVGFGVTHHKIRFGFTLNPEWEVGLEVGVAGRPFGASVTVIKFSARDGSLRFIPDPAVQFGVDFGPRARKWSRAEGFAQQVGAERSTLTGRMVFDASADVTTRDARATAAAGDLTFAGGNLTFTPSGSPPSLTGLGLLPGDPGPLPVFNPNAGRHIRPGVVPGQWVPEPGYLWLDGTREPRTDVGTGFVLWTPGVEGGRRRHLVAAREEGYWEPESGYVWSDGTRERRVELLAFGGTIRWQAGLPWPGHPFVVTSTEEGKVVPAAGFVWATDPPVGLGVRAARARPNQ